MRDDDFLPTAPERPSGQGQLYDTIRSCSGVLPNEFEVAETIWPPEPLALRTLGLSDEPGQLPLVVLSSQDDGEADFMLFDCAQRSRGPRSLPRCGPSAAIHMCAALIFSPNAIMAAAQRPPSRKSNKIPEPRPA